MQTDLIQHLLACAEAFAKARNYELSTVGRIAGGDESRFFTNLRDPEWKGTFTARKYDQVMAFFSENWPENTPWPKGVPRPRVKASAT